MGSNQLWLGVVSGSTMIHSGLLWDDRKFAVEFSYQNKSKQICLVIEDKDVSTLVNTVGLDIPVPAQKLVHDWTTAQWAGVDHPALWAEAGFLPIEAQALSLLPTSNPRRPNVGALEMLASLQPYSEFKNLQNFTHTPLLK